MKRKLLPLAGLVLSLSSCTVDADHFNSNELARITCIADDFISDNDALARSAVDVSNPASIAFQWSENDTVGIFPDQGDQVSFPMTNGAGTGSASFNGGGWALKNTSTYYSYYPFSRKAYDASDRITKIPYTFLGQKAVVPDADGCVKIGKYDYMAAQASTPANGGVTFTYKHLGALCRMAITFPKTGVYTGLTITAGEPVFPVEGTFDLTANPVVLNASEVASSITLDLDNLAGTEGETKEVYFMLPPADCSSLALKATLTDSESNAYEDDFLDKKNLEAGKAYGFSLITTPSDLSLEGTANCYIVSESGLYSLSPVKGNSSESVGTIASAEVLWEAGSDEVETGDLICGTKYKGGEIVFKTHSSYRTGNALIAAKDDKGDILWSWHIWFTPQPKDEVYRNNAGTMMDRDLGQTDYDVLFYQWGRKDPFPCYTSGYHTSKHNWITIAESDATTGTIDYSIKHPTTFIDRNSRNYDWVYSSESYSSTVYPTRWGSAKTIYDPCPVGYRVPDGGTEGVWYKATNDYASTDYLNAGSAYYNTPGYLSVTDGYLRNPNDPDFGYGCWWSCTWDSSWGNGMYIKYIAVSNYEEATLYNKRTEGNLSNGYSVRCQKETAD